MLGFNVDYLDYLDAFTLDEVTSSTSTIIIAIAVYLGEIRLIDNILVNEI
jgi:pantothenate synthetase